MSIINIKVKGKEEKILRVRDLNVTDVFTLQECQNQKIYMLTAKSSGCQPAVAVNLGTGEVRVVSGDTVVGEKFSKAEIILTP
ncbi:hypothetical protein phiL_095 [Escherichia phage LAMP]|uniref:Uncharacterized protein n=1 Tax=Escherichia phage LAMP TaxID=2065191 RepID=A0A2I6PD63_9CAUD|nr:hypothetical protein phiL_095 [Escherichia phage LAMP]